MDRLGNLAVASGLLTVLFAGIIAPESVGGQDLLIVGSEVNPDNGRTYLLVEPSNWTDSEAAAVDLGANLVTIGDQAEHDWVVDTFLGGVGTGLWLGLTDEVVEGIFEWTSGEPLIYENWAPGEPNNGGGNQHYGWIYGPGTCCTGLWDDIQVGGQAFDIFGVVEIPDCAVGAATDLVCTSAGPDIELTFTNNGPYDGGIDVFRDGTLYDTITNPDATSYTDAGVCIGSYTYLLRGNDVAAGCVTYSPLCTVDHGVFCPISAPTSFTCDQGNLSWDNGANIYSSIDVLRDGAVIETLPGTAESYDDMGAISGGFTYQLVGIDNNSVPCCTAESEECTTIFGATEICSSPALPIPDNNPNGASDIITFTESGALDDVDVSVVITHTWIGDLQVEIISPATTTVVGRDYVGLADNFDNIDVTFDDGGVPYDVSQLPNGLNMQPQGPGVMADFAGEEASGDWTLFVVDNEVQDTGTLDTWCVIAFGLEGGGPEFIRGDFDNNGAVNFLVDALFGLNAGFVPGAPQPQCFVAVDANGDRAVSFLVDSLFMLNAGFVPGSPLPPLPYPNCGEDQNGTDVLGCDNPNAVCNP